MSEKEFLTNSTENGESMEETEQEFSTLSSLHEISKSLLSEHDLQKLLDTIAENALRVLEADLVTLYEYNKMEDDVKIPPIIKGKAKEIDILLKRGKGHKKSIPFKMIKRKKPFYAENAKEDWAREEFISYRSVKKEGSFFKREGINSSAGIPLCIEEEVVGVLFVNYRESHQFTPARKDRIEMFANYAALAIRNARIFSKSQRYVKQLSVLNEIGKKISTAATSDIEEILYLVYEQTATIMDATNFYIAFYDKQNDMVHFKLAIEDGQRKRVGVREWGSRKAGNGLTEYIIRTKMPLLIQKEPERFLRFKHIDAIGKPANSWLGVPMIVEESVLGVIGMQSYEEGKIFDEDDINVLMTIASQAAIAISKANIFQEEKKRKQELEALYVTSREISEKLLDLKSVLQAVMKRAVELSKADGGAILLCDHARKKLTIVFTHNLEKLLGLRTKFGEGLAGRVAQSGKPMIQNEHHKWKEKHPIFQQKDYKILFRAAVGVPLKWESKVIGVLVITSSRKDKNFTGEDIRLLERFAIPAAIALHIARTYNYLQTLIDSTPEAIIAADKNGIITEFNRASEHILGYTMDEVIGKHVNILYWGGLDEAKRIKSLLQMSKSGKVRDVETFMKSKKGEKIPISFAGSMLFNEIGERIGSVGLMEDIREIRLLEGRYRALYEVGKVAVEIPESNMRKICQEFMDVLTKRVLHFKASYLYLVNEDGKLELMASGVKDTRFKHFDRVEKNNAHTSLVIPLIVRGDEIGKITVFKGEEFEFSEEEIEFLDRFASLAALVIDKAKDVHRSKNISELLQEITYDIIELSGETVYGDIWDKITTIIDINVPGTNFCLYKCDQNNDQLALLIESNSEDLHTILKTRFYSGESPFKSEINLKSDYLVLQARNYAQSGRLEGFLVFEKMPTKDVLIAKFTEVERMVLSMVTSAAGIALFRLRSLLRQNPPTMSEANNISKAE